MWPAVMGWPYQVPLEAASTRMTLLFWSAKTTLPWASKTAVSGEPSAPDLPGAPSATAVAVPPPATVTIVAAPARARAELGDASRRTDPARTAQAVAAMAATLTPPAS